MVLAFFVFSFFFALSLFFILSINVTNIHVIPRNKILGKSMNLLGLWIKHPLVFDH